MDDVRLHASECRGHASQGARRRALPDRDLWALVLLLLVALALLA